MTSAYKYLSSKSYQVKSAAMIDMKNDALKFFTLKEATKLFYYHLTPGHVNGFVRAVKQCITPPAAVAFAGATKTFAFLRISTA
jgi:hypothetical protein